MNETTVGVINICGRDDIVNHTTNKKYLTGSGLSNQIFTLTTNIIKNKKCNIIILDNFLSCIYTDILCDIREIIELDKTTANLNKLPDYSKLHLLSRNSSLKIEILQCEYGRRDIYIM